MKQALWLAFILLFSFYSYSQPLTLVKKDEWGSSMYIDVIKIGDYIYAVSSTNKLDIIDPTKQLSEQLVGQLELTGSYNADDLNNYNGFLSITLNDKVVFYSLTNPVTPELVYEFSIDNAINSGQKVTEGQKHYIVEKNKLYVVNYNESSEFEIVAVQTLEDLTYDIIHSYQVNIDQNSLFIHQVEVTYSSGEEEMNYVIREYDINDLSDIKLVSKATTLVELFYPKLAYIGQHHFALSTQDNVQIFKAEGNEIELVSELDIDTHSLGLYWQKDTNRLRVIASYSWYSYLLDSYSAPVLESKESIKSKNRINTIYQFLSDNDAIVQTQTPSTIATIDLTEQDSLTPLYDQSGWLQSMAVSEDMIFALKNFNVHALNIQSDELRYNDKLTSGDSTYIFRSVSVKDQTVFVDSNDKTSVFESNATSLPEFQFDVNIPTTGYINKSVSNEKIRILAEGSTPTIHWYDIENPLNILIPPLSLDLSTYEIEESTSIKSVYKMHLVNGYLAVSGITVDRKMYLLIIRNNGQSLEVTDYSYVDSSNWANFFVGNDNLYQVIRYDNNLTEYEISDEGKLSEVQTVTLTLSDVREEVFNGIFFGEYLITQTYQHLQVYDYSTSELTAIGEFDILPTYSVKVEMDIVNEKLVVGNYTQGTLSLFEFNVAPVSQNKFEIDEDSNFDIRGLFNDPEGDEISFEVITAPEHGEISVSAGLFTPNQDFYGEDKFTVKVADVHGNFIEQEIKILVLSVNDAPIINTTELDAIEDTEIVEMLDIYDVEGDQLSYAIEEQPLNGTASLNDVGELTYTPISNYFGSDSVKVLATDIHGANDIQTINIIVESINDLPELIASSYEGEEDKTIEGRLTASDIDDDELSFSVVAGSSNFGEVSIQSDGEFVFTPDENYFGQASFMAQVTDTKQGIDQQTIIINVEGSDDAPVAESLTTSVSHNGTISNSLATTDVDGDSLEYSIVDDVAHGTLSLSSIGEYTYTPNSGYSGSDVFTYEVTDAQNSAKGTITFSVMAAPPVVKAEKSSGGGSMGYILSMVLIGLFRFRKDKVILS